jgi:[NiFe] hydrogenase diaphorase moiety small subunit
MADSALLPTDRAANICPVGAILHKRQGFRVPIGQRLYDQVPVSEQPEESKS